MNARQQRYFSKKTKSRRLNQLVDDINNNSHKEELIALLSDQVHDDTHRLNHQVFVS